MKVSTSFLIIGCLFGSIAFSPLQAGLLRKTPAELDAKIIGAQARFEALQAKPKRAIPPVILRTARGIVIIRKLKAGLGFGAEAGGGVALAKSPDGVWSAPAFVGAAEASWGIQFGAQDQDIIMVLMTEEGLKMLKEGRRGNIGVETQAALGPVDISKKIDTDNLAPILIYRDAVGAFAGIGLKGGGIVGAKKKNMTYYGMTMPEILFSGKAPISENGQNLIKSIIKQSNP